MSQEQYLERFRGTAVRRAKHWMLQRNAAVALGNVGSIDALPHLVTAMRSNEHPVVRGHAAWAVGRIGERLGSPDARTFLEEALKTESDETVREEISFALRDLEY
jgi:epoxyqueuosine reductase